MRLAAFVSDSLKTKAYGRLIQQELEKLRRKTKRFAHNRQFNRFAESLACEVYTPHHSFSRRTLPDEIEGRAGNYACLWECSHAIFFWDETEDAVADTIRAAYRMRRRIYVMVGRNNQLYLLHKE